MTGPLVLGHRVLLILLASFCLGLAPLRIPGSAPSAVLVALPDSPDAEPDCGAFRLAEQSPMIADMLGVLGILERAHVARLRQRSVPVDALPDDARTIGAARLIADDACPQTDFATSGDLYFASHAGVHLRLNRVTAARLLGPLLREPHASPARAPRRPLSIGWVGELEPAYAASDIELSRAEVNDRLNHRSSPVRYDTDGVKRVLARERIVVRVPQTLESARPAPLLVWISPTTNGTPPGAFGPVLDELGMVAVGVHNAGNDRRAIDRMQLVFDAVETVSTRVPIDQSRVYLAGFSGGGRVSSILLHTYPDRFAGAVPIVGLNSYHRVNLDGGRYIQGMYPRPRGSRLNDALNRRLFAITGSLDFNRDEMLRRHRMLEDDGFPARIEVVAGMRHEQMPPESVIAAALRWVDEPARAAMTEADARAAALVSEAEALQPEARPAQEKARDLLLEATRVSPWSPAAWRAAKLLLMQPEG